MFLWKNIWIDILSWFQLELRQIVRVLLSLHSRIELKTDVPLSLHGRPFENARQQIFSIVKKIINRKKGIKEIEQCPLLYNNLTTRNFGSSKFLTGLFGYFVLLFNFNARQQKFSILKIIKNKRSKNVYALLQLESRELSSILWTKRIELLF